MAEPDEKPKKTQKSSDNPEDHLQLKHPKECEMLVPVEPGSDPSVAIPPSKETEHKSTESPIAPTAQLAPEDHSHFKNLPELGMQVPVEPGLNPSDVIPPSTETEHESTDPTIAPESQLANAVSSKLPVDTKHCQGKELPT